MSSSSDILVLSGLETQIANSPHVLPDGVDSMTAMNENLVDLITFYPGTLVVVRSVMKPDNCIFSKGCGGLRLSRAPRNAAMEKMGITTQDSDSKNRRGGDKAFIPAKGAIQDMDGSQFKEIQTGAKRTRRHSRFFHVDGEKAFGNRLSEKIMQAIRYSYDRDPEVIEAAKEDLQNLPKLEQSIISDILDNDDNDFDYDLIDDNFQKTVHIMHDEICKNLHVRPYCTRKHEHDVYPPFEEAIARRRALTIVAFRDNVSHADRKNIRDEGYGPNLSVRGHDFMNSLIDENHGVIIPWATTDDYDVRILRVREVLSAPVMLSKPKSVRLFDFIANTAACRALNRSSGQWKLGDGLVQSYPHAINESIKDDKKPYAKYTQRVLFAGNTPSMHCLKTSMASLQPIQVTSTDADGYTHEVKVDLRPMLLTGALSLSNEPGKAITYEQALTMPDTCIFRHILIKQQANDMTTKISQKLNTMKDAGLPQHIAYAEGEYLKPLDVGCLVLGNPSSGEGWSTVLPIESSLRDLDMYVLVQPEREVFTSPKNPSSLELRESMSSFAAMTPIVILTKNCIMSEAESTQYMLGSDAYGPLHGALSLLHTWNRKRPRMRVMDLCPTEFQLYKNFIRNSGLLLGFAESYLGEKNYRYAKKVTNAELTNSVYALDSDGKPLQPEYAKSGPYVAQRRTPAVMVVFVDVGNEFNWAEDMREAVLRASHLVVVAFGKIAPSRAPTTEQLYLRFPHANYVANLTTAGSLVPASPSARIQHETLKEDAFKRLLTHLNDIQLRRDEMIKQRLSISDDESDSDSDM